jgi:hypothetical protein
VRAFYKLAEVGARYFFRSPLALIRYAEEGASAILTDFGSALLLIRSFAKQYSNE